MSFIDGEGTFIDNPWCEQAWPSTKRAATWDCRWSSQRIHDNVEPDRAPPRVRRDRRVRQSVLRPRPGSLLRVVVEGRSIRYVSAPLLRYRIHAVKGALKVKVEWTDVAAFHLSRVRSAEAGFYARSGQICAVACLQNFRLPPFRTPAPNSSNLQSYTVVCVMSEGVRGLWVCDFRSQKLRERAANRLKSLARVNLCARR
jgi:hypothetical protein